MVEGQREKKGLHNPCLVPFPNVPPLGPAVRFTSADLLRPQIGSYTSGQNSGLGSLNQGIH